LLAQVSAQRQVLACVVNIDLSPCTKTFHRGWRQRHGTVNQNVKPGVCLTHTSTVEATWSHSYRRPHVSTFHQWYGEWWLAAIWRPERSGNASSFLTTKHAPYQSNVLALGDKKSRCQLPNQQANVIGRRSNQRRLRMLAQIVTQACLDTERTGPSSVSSSLSCVHATASSLDSRPRHGNRIFPPLALGVKKFLPSNPNPP